LFSSGAFSTLTRFFVGGRDVPAPTAQHRRLVQNSFRIDQFADHAREPRKSNQEKHLATAKKAKAPAVKKKPVATKVARKVPPAKKPAPKSPAKAKPKAAVKTKAPKAAPKAAKVSKSVAAKKPTKPTTTKAKPVAKVAAKVVAKTLPKPKPASAKAAPAPKVVVAAKPTPKVSPKGFGKTPPTPIRKTSKAPLRIPEKPVLGTSRSTGKNIVTAPTTTPSKDGRPHFASMPVAPKPLLVASVPSSSRPAPKSTLPSKAEKHVAYVPKTTREAGLLSEADLMKQSKNDYMSKDQLAFFKHRLTELAAQLRENAGATTEHLRELAIVPDPADRATLEEEHALELRARDRERKLLKKVEAALLRIDDGSYGYCEETGDPIGIARLLARPTATLTIEAQERRELKQKLFGE
jgi:DnaK suppressor protein